MKKLLSLILVAVIAVAAFGVSAYAYTGHVNAGDTLNFSGATSSNAFGDLTDWTGIVFGNVNNIIDSEGSLAVGGSFNSTRGFSVNGGAYGNNPALTEDVAFLIKNNVNISGYGSVWGQTVVGNADGNTYRLSNVTPSETTNGKFTVADSAKYFADAKSTAQAVKSAVSSLQSNGECESANGTYTFKGNSDADTLVYNLDASDISSYLFDFTIADGQTVIVNLTASGKIKFKNGAFKINGNMDPDYLRKYNRNIILNVVNATEIEMTSCELYGILLAPEADLTGSNASVCGTSILNGLTGLNGFELHVGYNTSFVPSVSASASANSQDVIPSDEEGEKVSIRVDVPLKMAVAFEDGSICYGGEMKEFVVGKEYLFQMCSVNWENGTFDDTDNGLRGTVVYRMIAVHRNEFIELAKEAKNNPDRYTVKGIDIIDNVEKKILLKNKAHIFYIYRQFFTAVCFYFLLANCLYI